MMEYTYTLADGILCLVALNEGRPERSDDGEADGLGLTAVERVAQALLRRVQSSIGRNNWDSVDQCVIDALADAGHIHLIDLDLWDSEGMPDSTARLVDDAWHIALVAIFTHRAAA
jgi:hypothetical protein